MLSAMEPAGAKKKGHCFLRSPARAAGWCVSSITQMSRKNVKNLMALELPGT